MVRSFHTLANLAPAIASRPRLDNQPFLFHSYIITGLIKYVLACRCETHDSIVSKHGINASGPFPGDK